MFRFESKFLTVDDFPSIMKIETIHGNIEMTMRYLHLLSRMKSRVIIAHHEKSIIGHYIYAPFMRWSLLKHDTIYIKNELRKLGIELETCCVPVSAHFTPKHENPEMLLEINNARVDDARKMGYTHGIVGVNSTDLEFCLERPLIKMHDELGAYSDAKIVPIQTKLNGHKVFVQYYVSNRQ